MLQCPYTTALIFSLLQTLISQTDSSPSVRMSSDSDNIGDLSDEAGLEDEDDFIFDPIHLTTDAFQVNLVLKELEETQGEEGGRRNGHTDLFPSLSSCRWNSIQPTIV